MIRPHLPDPLRDELSDDAKAALAVIFAGLKLRYPSDFHREWRAQERLRNAVMNLRYDRDL